MKHQLVRVAGIFCLMLLAATATAGTWSTNKFFYQPALDARGATEKNNFDTGLNQVDTHLGQYKTLGDPNYSTLAEALTTIGSTNVTLTIPAGTVTIASNTTIGNNIALRVFKGGKFSVNSGVTLTINGPIEAGPYQIFSGSGTVTLGGVSTIYDVWYAVPPSNPQGNIAAPIGSRFIKTTGSAPLVYVKESGTGNTGWVASSGGSGATAFTGLNDVPGSYSGQAGKSLRVNSNSNGLEFYTPSSSGGVKPFNTLGEANYATLSQALATIGSTATTLIIPAEAGPVSVASNTTIPANVDLRILKGGRFDVANGVTLTIKGSVDAGPYQIFSWTGSGKIDISNSITKECSLTWWGAQSDPINGPYTHDISAALLKAVEGLAAESGQTLTLPKGVWRIATPTTIIKPWAQFRLRGVSMWDTQIYVDVGSSNVALTIGQVDADHTNLEISKLSFVGPANCCNNALKIFRVHDVLLDDVNFWCGSKEYALDLEGCLWVHGSAHVCEWVSNYAAGGYIEKPHDGIKIASTANPNEYQTNVCDLRVVIHQCGGVGILIDGSAYHSATTRLYGSIECCQSNPIRIYNQTLVTLTNLYTEGNNNEDILIENSSDIFIENLLTNSLSHGLSLVNCRSVTLNNFNLGSLNIDGACKGVVLLTGSVDSTPNDNAPDTQYLGLIRGNAGQMQTNYAVPQSDQQNIIYNSLFNRWKADGPEGGWGVDDGSTWSWSQAGIGLGDTTHYNSDYCAKLTTVSTSPTFNYTFDANQIRKMGGHTVTYSLPVMFPTGQTLAEKPLSLLWSVSVPSWAANTFYQAQDGAAPVGVSMVSGIQFFCVSPGTSGGSEPSWATHEFHYTQLSATPFTPGETIEWASGGNPGTGIYLSIDTTKQMIKMRMLTGGYPPYTGTITGRSSGATCTITGVAQFTTTNDGTIVWKSRLGGADAASEYNTTTMGTGNWRRLGFSFTVPRNATDVHVWHGTTRSGSNNFHCYFANPSVTVGVTAATASIPSQGEFPDYVMFGGLKMTAGTSANYPPSPKQGDIHWNKGATGGLPSYWQWNGSAWVAHNL